MSCCKHLPAGQVDHQKVFRADRFRCHVSIDASHTCFRPSLKQHLYCQLWKIGVSQSHNCTSVDVAVTSAIRHTSRCTCICTWSWTLVHCVGGSRSSNASILTRLHALAEAEQQLGHHTAALHQAQATLQAMSAAAASHNRYTQTHHNQTAPCCSTLLLPLTLAVEACIEV